MAFPGFLKLVGNVETKRLTDRHSRYNQRRSAPRQRETGAQANQDTQSDRFGHLQSSHDLLIVG
jgi:hypothetical protein